MQSVPTSTSRSLAAEGTVFWLAVVAISLYSDAAIILTTEPTESMILVATIIIFAVVSTAVALLCWTPKRFRLLAAIIWCLILLVSGFANGLSFATHEEVLLTASTFLALFFSYRAYGESRRG